MIPENKPLRLFDDADLHEITRFSTSLSDNVVSVRDDLTQSDNYQYEVQMQISATVKNETDPNCQFENFKQELARSTGISETHRDDANRDNQLRVSNTNISSRKESLRVTPRTLDASIDNKLLDALINVKERKNVLTLEQEIHAFVLSPAKTLTFSPKTNTYRRMLIHQIAERYRLNRSTLNGTEGKPCLVLTKSSDVRVPKPLLSEIEIFQDLPPDSGSAKAVMNFNVEPNADVDPCDHRLLHLDSLSTKRHFDAIVCGQQQPRFHGSVQHIMSQQQSQLCNQQRQQKQQLQQNKYQQPIFQDRMDLSRSHYLPLPPHSLSRESRQQVMGPQIPRQLDTYGKHHGHVGTKSQLPRYDQSETRQVRAPIRVPSQDQLDNNLLDDSYEIHGYRMTQSVPESSGADAALGSAMPPNMKLHLGNFANQFNPGHAYAYGRSSGYIDDAHINDAYTQFEYHQHQ